MESLLHNLGIDWKLLLSQGVNFFVLLFVLRAVAYRPLVALMKQRRADIEEGITKAKEADERLGQVNVLAKEKLAAAEAEALSVLHATEEKAKHVESELLAQARTKEAALMRDAELKAQAKAEEIRRATEQEAAALVKAAIVKTVELAPDAVDEALIKKAVAAVRAGS